MIASRDNERSVLARCQKGDVLAFEALVRRHMRPAYSIALGLVGNRDDALDLSQEAFIRAYRNMKKFDPTRRFFPWFYQILKNLCFNHLKRRRSQRISSLQDLGDRDVEVQVDSCFDPTVVVERDELKDRVWQAMGKLGPKHREIIILRHFQDLSYSEISEVLFCSKGTVMSRLYYARKALKDLLEQDEGR